MQSTEGWTWVKAYLILIFLCSLTQKSHSSLQHVRSAKKAGDSLNFLVVGDWGRKGLYNQSRVANQMGRIGEELGIDFVISTGDNFYDNGLTGIGDPSFEESFSGIYTAKSLQTPWYSVLGNHDYRGNVLAQLSPSLRIRDPRWNCERSFVLKYDICPHGLESGEHTSADFFFLDTNPFIDQYWEPGNHTYDWRGVNPRQKYLKQQLQAYGVDLYVNGHDHCLEHISGINSPLQFLTSGGGSKAWKGMKEGANMEGLQFFHNGQGFMSFNVQGKRLHVTFYDVEG